MQTIGITDILCAEVLMGDVTHTHVCVYKYTVPDKGASLVCESTSCHLAC